MAHVLVVDDDLDALTVYEKVLRTAFSVHCSPTADRALQIAEDKSIDVILLDLHLGGKSGLDLLRQLRLIAPSAAVVIITGFGSLQSAVEAMRLGACDYLIKPIAIDELVKSTALAARRIQPMALDTVPQVQHAIARWADAVVRALPSRRDPRTLELWGRCIGASTGAVRNWCSTAGFSPKRSLAFVRMLRAVLWHEQTGGTPENLLDVADRRTLTKLLRLGRYDLHSRAPFPSTLEHFILTQQWIQSDNALQLITEALARLTHLGDRTSTTVQLCEQQFGAPITASNAIAPISTNTQAKGNSCSPVDDGPTWQ